jgi:hypothetical protein
MRGALLSLSDPFQRWAADRESLVSTAVRRDLRGPVRHDPRRSTFAAGGKRMKRTVREMLVALVFVAAMVPTTQALAEEWPLVQGDHWEVTGIHLKDGGALSYANFLANEWPQDQEFAKSKGWIKSYTVLVNAYPRKGEPDLYLIAITEGVPSGPEGEKRNAEYMAWSKTSIADQQKASGNRAEFREVGSSSLLQEMKFR